MCDDFYSNNNVNNYDNVVIPEDIEDPFDAIALAYNLEDDKKNKEKIKEHEEKLKKEKQDKLMKEQKEKERIVELNKRKENEKKKLDKKGKIMPKNTTKFIDDDYDDYY